jgi:hypothetical protein
MSNFLHTLVSRERPTQSAGERTNMQAAGLIAPRVASIFEAKKHTQGGEIHRANDDAISDRFAFDENIVRDSYESQKWTPSNSDQVSGNRDAGLNNSDNSAFSSSRAPLFGTAESVSEKMASDENNHDTVSTPRQRARGSNQSRASETNIQIRSNAAPSSDANQEPRYRANPEGQDKTITPVATAIATPLDSLVAQMTKTSITPQIRITNTQEDGTNARQRHITNIMPTPLTAMTREGDFYRRGADISLPTSNTERTINITIGRVEVRATTTNATNSARTNPKASSGPRPMGLDEYLAARNKRG